MKHNPFARFLGLTKNEFSIFLYMGGLLVLVVMLFEGYILYTTGRAVPVLLVPATPAASPTEAAAQPTRAQEVARSVPGVRSLPEVLPVTPRVVLPGGVIAGPAEEGGFMAEAATARMITAPARTAIPTATATLTNTPAASPTASGTATATPRQTRTIPTRVPAPVATFLEPVPLGTSFEIPGWGSLTVVKSSWLPGQTGLTIVELSFTCGRPAGDRCNTSKLMLDTLGGSGAGYARVFDAAIPEPTFGTFTRPALYGGETETGNAGFVITNSESSLKLRVQIFLESGEYFFWLGGG